MDEKDANFFEVIQEWFLDNWWVVGLIILGAWLVRRFGEMVVTSIVRRSMRHRTHGDLTEEDIKKRQDTLIAMFSAILRILVWTIAGFSIFGRVFPDVNLAPLLASAGVLGVAIGFGAQTLIKDFLSGLFIILENQYRVGDVVTIDGADGTVEQITLRSTIIRDNDGSVHYIPNGSIAHAINKTMGFARINMVIEVSSSTDVDALAKVINSVGEKLAKDEKWKNRIMDPPHFLGIDAFDTSTLEVKIVGKTQPSAQWSVTGELRKRLVAAFKKEEIIAAKIPGADAGKKK